MINKKGVSSVAVTALLISSILFVFTIVYVEPASAAYTPYFNKWGEQTLATDSLRIRFPGVALAPNGDLVMTYCRGDTKDYSCWMELWCRISHDNGSTWDAAFMITNFSSYVGEVGWTIKTMPNGDMCFLFTDDHEWDLTANSTDIWRSSNNGAQGSWAYSNNFSEFGKCYVYDWMVFGDSVYAFVNDPDIFQPCESYIAISNDSGYTWSKLGNSIGSIGGEWSTVPLNANATHWKTINRFTSFGNGPSGTSSCGSQGSGSPYAPFLEQYETTDGCITWAGTNSNCPDDCSDPSQSSNQYNKGNYMWWLDDQIIVANVEGNDNYAAVTINSDNLSNDAWSNHTHLGYEGGSAPKNAYSRGCALPKRGGQIGGWGYVVWSEERNTYVKGAWIANNNSLDWSWPPGPYEAPQIEFLDINGGGNGTVLFDSTPTFNWSVISRTAMYHLQVANDSAFTDLVINLTNINYINYPSNYIENSSVVSFTLPIEYELPNYKRYYCKIRPYEREV